MSKTRQFLLFFGVTALVTVGFGWISLLIQERRDAPRRPPPPVSFAADSGEKMQPKRINDFALVDSEGVEFDSADFRGQVWVASFFSSKNPASRRQQDRILALNDEFHSDGVRFASITIAPETDTPELLKQHAESLHAEGGAWLFLTGEMDEIDSIAKDFRLKVDSNIQLDWLVVIDRWGWIRGLFYWRTSQQIAAMRKMLNQLLQETENPHDRYDASGTADRPEGWMQDFTLTERSGQPCSSQDLRGHVWVASFFFSTCPSVCRTQNQLVASLHERYGRKGVIFVCITCDPQTDTPEVLAEYARLFDADPEQWLFLTGDLESIQRIGAEVFQVPVKERVHVERFLVMDQQGQLRGSYDWHDAKQLKELEQQLDTLLAEAEGGP
jgi:cytochrome oxidase Cu insertion factor (SCO1/SenC/PrrC family)